MNELTPQKAFEEKVKDRLREDIGTLIPDEVLAEMVQKAIKEIFFSSKGESWQSTYEPSWFKKEIDSLMRSKINAYVEEAIEKQRTLIEKLSVEIISEQMPYLIVSTFMDILCHTTEAASNDVRTEIMNKLSQRGLNVY